MAGNTDRAVVADWRDTPAPIIVCNFPMEIVQGSPIAHTAWNGATRQIPGTQSHRSGLPTLEDEPRWMKLSTTAPAPAGAAMLRDIRAWHGGTPNVGNAVRGIPCSVWHAPWFVKGDVGAGTMPWETYAKLSPKARLYCRYLVQGQEDPTRVWSAPSFEPSGNDRDGAVAKQNVARI